MPFVNDILADKLDKLNRKNSIHSNLIKWWDVNLLSGDEQYNEDYNEEDNENYIESSENIETIEEELSFQDLDDESKNKVNDILTQNDRSKVYDIVNDVLGESEVSVTEATAMEIYERLMREAAEDEAKKQHEIEMAKLAAANM